MMSAMTKKHVI